jgi:beta-glucosidase
MDIEKIIGELTLEEKAALCSGRDFWHLKGIERYGIPPVMLTDGPHGLRKEIGGSGAVLTESVPATCFPTASCLASTWNRALLFRIGESIAEEALEEGVSILLGPGANVKRSPLCGRNFEYFSEDPCLSGEMAKSWIDGAQSKGVGASLKHYAVNNQEHRRMTINADVDERALREIYLAGFERAVRGAQPWTVMGAYNRLNSIYCCEHDYLLNKVLRQEWGFEGLVVTDWGAMNNRVEALMAGCDLEMPGVPNGNTEKIIQAVHGGQLDESVLDETVRRILRLIEMSVSNMRSNFHYDRGAHHALAKEAAGEGAVLLKNEMNLLPLDTQAAVALIGAFARKPRYQGSGSSLMNPNQLDTLYDEMVRLAGKDKIEYAPGYDLESSEATPRLIEEALAAARKADYAVVSAGLPDMYEVEGVDRENMALPPGHNALIKAVAAANPRTIVVLSNGAPVEMPWLGRVGAVLEGYLGGQAGAGAAAEILYGYINPSGKLCETFPVNLEDNSSNAFFPGGPAQVEYRESIFVGYRFYDSVEKQVRFPFGHGLSFTTFEYSDLCCEPRILNLGEDLVKSHWNKANPGKYL